MTFHSACARMLRADAERLGYTRGFTIYDEGDSLRQVKACVDELDVDPKRFAPRGIRRQISDAKNALLDAEAYRLKVGSFFEQTAADVYDLYEQRMHAANAMDFDDLLFRSVNLFELFPEVRERYRRAFRLRDGRRVPGHQPRPVPLAAAARGGAPQPLRGRRRRSVLVEGTPITMADGSTNGRSRRSRPGRRCSPCYGSGDFRPAGSRRLTARSAAEGVAITTEAGRRLVSTREHVHFAGYNEDCRRGSS